MVTINEIIVAVHVQVIECLRELIKKSSFSVKEKMLKMLQCVY